MQREVGERVECRAEAAYPGRPLAFTFQGQRWKVVDVLKSWRSPQGVGYRVSIEDGRFFELLYDQALVEWVVVEF
jgi:hypothetical protein